MKIVENCAVPNMPEHIYHADPCPEVSLSSSMLSDLIERTEIEAKMANRRLNPNYKNDDSSDESELGTMAHDFVLRGGSQIYQIAPYKDWKTNAAKEAREMIESRGLIALNETTAERTIPKIEAMKKALHEQLDAHEDFPGIMRQGKPELSVFSHDGQIWNRARLDWLEESSAFNGMIVDYKTTGLSFRQWENQVLWDQKAKYLQSLHYKKTMSLLTKKDHRFVFVVQRTVEPYLIRVIEIDSSVDEFVQSRYDMGRMRFIHCLKTGIFRGEPLRTWSAVPPPWIMSKWEIEESNWRIINSDSNKHLQNVAMAG